MKAKSKHLTIAEKKKKFPGLRDEVYADLQDDGNLSWSGETLYYRELLRLYPRKPRVQS